MKDRLTINRARIILAQHLKDYWFFYFFGIVLYLQNSWVSGMFPDGYLYMALGKNAAELGHWLVPFLDPDSYPVFYDHTPFIFILEGLFFKVFGSSVTAARIFSSLFTLSFIPLTFYFIKEKNLRYFTILLFLFCYPIIKQTRFPNLDIPLLLFTFLSLFLFYEAYTNEDNQKYYLSGLFFGLCLLTKGPLGLFPPYCAFLYLIYKKDFKTIINPHLLFSALLGFFIFSLWPLSLKLAGRFDVFEKWYYFTFIESILEGRGGQSSFFLYFKILLSKTHIYIPLFLIGSWKGIKEKNDLIVFCLITFFSSLLIISIPSHKYGHYLIPLYPTYLIVCAFGLSHIFKWGDRWSLGLKVLGPVLCLSLLIFPLTNESRRDKIIFTVWHNISKEMRNSHTWYNVDHSYPYTFYSLFSYLGPGKGVRVEVEDLDELILKKQGFYLFRESLYLNLSDTLKAKMYLVAKYKGILITTDDQNFILSP